MKQIKMKQAITFLFLMFPLLAFCQHTGGIEGKIYDGETGEGLLGAPIRLDGTAYAVSADMEGNFKFQSIPAGEYNLKVGYIGYSTLEQSVKVNPGKVTELELVMVPEDTLQETVIEAKKLENSESSVLSMRKDALEMQDGMSVQEMNRTGSSNIAESMKQVTGTSIEDGKYMVVRGLGDRYSIAQVNGISMPSTDPYRNSTNLDIIPTSMVDNVITSKTFTPDNPGNFTGGSMNITTRSFPDKFMLNFSTSVAYNTNSSFNPDFLTYQGGKYDWLGYDDGTRAMPDILKEKEIRDQLNQSIYIYARRNAETASLLNETARSLSTDFVPIKTVSPLDHGISFSTGNTVKLFGNKLGFVVGGKYSRSFSFYQNGVSAGHSLTGIGATTLLSYFDYTDAKGTENPQTGLLGNIAYQLAQGHEVSLSYMYSHDAEKISRYQEGYFPGALSSPDDLFQTRTLQWKERSLNSWQLRGRHDLIKLRKARLEWSGGYILSSQDEPDMRLFANHFNGSSYFLSKSQYDYPFHFFRQLSDRQYEAKADLNIPVGRDGSGNSIKVGGSYSSKNRNFDEYRFQVENQGSKGISFTSADGDFAKYFAMDNMGIIDSLKNPDGTYSFSTGNFIINQSRDDNFYTGHENIAAGFVMGVFEISKGFKAIAGTRIEKTDILVKSQNEKHKPGQISSLDILPSLNLVYNFNEKNYLRGAFSQTVARPNMRELAPFSSFDFIGGFIYTGNTDLKRTLIRNYDIRYEFFPRSGEMFSVSAYHKDFLDPIIKVYNPKTSNAEVMFKNVDQAKVYGLEFEMRKNLDFIGGFFKHFKATGNFTLIYSRVDIPQDEYDASIQINSEFSKWRPFQGQSPYIVNAGLSYVNPDKGITSALTFNVAAKRLSEVSLLGTPDIYESARGLLNLNAKKTFKERYEMGINAGNILNSAFEKAHYYKGEKYVSESYLQGRTFSFSISYQIK